MGIVMTVTIQLKAIMMKETAVHLITRQWEMLGMTFVQNVNVFSPLARTNGQQANVARSVTQKNVRSPAHVRRTARTLAIYAAVKNLARIKKVPSIVRSKRKRGNVTKQKFGRNARRLVINVIDILISTKSFFSKAISFELSTNFSDKNFCRFVA